MSTERVRFEKNRERIALLTDSCADLDAKTRKNKPIFLLPLQIRCGDHEYADGVDIFADDVFALQAKGATLKTSLPAGETVDRVLDEIAAKGYRKVLAVMLSSSLSGTYNMVRLRAMEREDLDIFVYDSKSGSLGMGAVVLQLCEDIEKGYSWKLLCERRVQHLQNNTFPFFSVDTLEMLEKGGRIGKVTAIAGKMMNIKPILSFAEDGQLVSVAKVRGRNAVQDKFIELLRSQLKDHKRYNLAVAHGDAQAEMNALLKKMKAAFPDYEHVWTAQLDATLSCYIGSGMLGAAIQFLD